MTGSDRISRGRWGHYLDGDGTELGTNKEWTCFEQEKAFGKSQYSKGLGGVIDYMSFTGHPGHRWRWCWSKSRRTWVCQGSGSGRCRHQGHLINREPWGPTGTTSGVFELVTLYHPEILFEKGSPPMGPFGIWNERSFIRYFGVKAMVTWFWPDPYPFERRNVERRNVERRNVEHIWTAILKDLKEHDDPIVIPH